MRNIILPLFHIKKRIFGVFVALFLVIIELFAFYDYDYDGMKQNLQQITEEQAYRTHLAIVNEFMKDRKDWPTSVLGSLLFKYDTYAVPQNKTFFVHVKNYQHSIRTDPLEGCSVVNCVFFGDNSKMPAADAVLIHLQRDNVPKVKHRHLQQRWIFLNDESPRNIRPRRPFPLDEWINVFNWSMTYRSDADIPVTYGRTVPLDKPIFKNFDTSLLTEIIPNWYRKTRDVLVTILVSNCIYFRMNFIRRLQKHIAVDVFGMCSQNKSLKYRCPGHFRKKCLAISPYLFYLALENSDCREYLTEKIWYNAYFTGAIPIIMGPSLNDCKRLLPPNSFLYIPFVSTDSEIEELAKYIVHLSENDDLLLSYHQWRNHFVVINDHGYFGGKSARLCRLCEGLNFNDGGQKIYNEQDIRWLLDANLLCGKNNV